MPTKTPPKKRATRTRSTNQVSPVVAPKKPVTSTKQSTEKPLKQRSTKWLAILFMVTGAIGLLASFALTYDKIQVLKNPAYDPSCNINPILSCGSVMQTEQASLLGVPNTIFGLVAFAALITFGVLLFEGARVNRRIWLSAQVAAIGGVVFMHYLFFQGVYRINAICPWCFVVWMITIPIFWYITQYNLNRGYLPVPRGLQPVAYFIQRYSGDILFAWYFAIFAILITRFWYYWSTLL